MVGPIDENSVLNNVLSINITCNGYDGSLTFGGLVTKQTLDGWDANGDTVRGAYTNMINPLNVPIRMTEFSGVGYIPDPFAYTATLIALIGVYDCDATSTYAYLRIGQGIYKQDSSKTWVDVEANGKTTFFTIVDPPNGYKTGLLNGCMTIFPFDCCFATLTTAYICNKNPQLADDDDGQLDNAYIPLQVEANVTLLINNLFEISIKMYEDYFPLAFGYEVYNYGGIVDLLTCDDIDF